MADGFNNLNMLDTIKVSMDLLSLFLPSSSSSLICKNIIPIAKFILKVKLLNESYMTY